eukprot:SAG11_NODE_2721_length_3044_cov_10.912733_1_plen_55_part_00
MWHICDTACEDSVELDTDLPLLLFMVDPVTHHARSADLAGGAVFRTLPTLLGLD